MFVEQKKQLYKVMSAITETNQSQEIKEKQLHIKSILNPKRFN